MWWFVKWVMVSWRGIHEQAAICVVIREGKRLGQRYAGDGTDWRSGAVTAG